MLTRIVDSQEGVWGGEQCGRVLVRITSDSSVRSVHASDNRLFVFAGNANILDQDPLPEDIMILRGRVLDSVP